ncbi:hypothetical protein Pmani_026371 [Petrolisthes manimaculis]|uniref:Uncharacterized protein n=1 Tax=Petrolisthes manimaculis TaxID=1843537 RepID=A0AAE1TWS8_9EUCA|nr:hypothetical protein Pmani_026371 [Petrolisthes manimaculis]
MCVKLGLDVSWRNPVLGTSLAIIWQRTVSTDRTTIDPNTSLDSEMEVENIALTRISTPPSATGTPSQALSSLDHDVRDRIRETSREKKKRRHRDSSSSSSSLRKKSLFSIPRASREEVSSLPTQFQELVLSLPGMLSRMIESRLPGENNIPFQASSPHSDLHVIGEERERLQDLEEPPSQW